MESTDAIRAAVLNLGKKKTCGICGNVGHNRRHHAQGEQFIRVRSAAAATHPHEWRAYDSFVSRCTIPTHRRWADYGGRGITVSREWLGVGGFDRFLAEVGPRPSPKHSVDRVDNERGYEPGNVKWSTTKEQSSNKRPSSRRVR